MQQEAGQQGNEPLRSTYADDEAIAEILPVFINNMPRYLNDLEGRISAGDWAGAARVCHDLKGTAGGYGYPDIGRAAQLLEGEVKGDHQKSAIEKHFAVVKSLCARAKLGIELGAPPGATH
jgi:HPt (histidine-containing phosphotransfer) domain-containing protein